MTCKKGLRYLLTLARSAMNARTMAGWVLRSWALVAGMFVVLCMLLTLRHLLLDEVAADEFAADAVEHTVNVTAASRSAVCLGEVYILVDRDGSRDAREVHHLGDGNLHDNHIHIGKT